MNINSSIRGLIRPARLALVVGVATFLVGAVLELPAAAAPPTPYATSTTVKSSVTAAVTGQAVTWTATVKATGRNLPHSSRDGRLLGHRGRFVYPGL